MKRTNRYLFLLANLLAAGAALAFEYPYAPYNEGKMEPQLTGWPLTDAEKDYVLKPEYERRPGREANQHRPALWPAVPSAGNWGGTSWLDTHANLVKSVQANKGSIDVLLVGDSITMQWGAAWTKHFPMLKTVNIGIGGDKTQNVLWRLDHGSRELYDHGTDKDEYQNLINKPEHAELVARLHGLLEKEFGPLKIGDPTL